MRGYHIRIGLSNSATGFPPNLFSSLPSEKPKPTARRNALFSHKGKDYRFGPIRIDWIDFSSAAMATKGGDVAVKDKEKAHGQGPASAVFVPGTAKSGSTNLPEGTVHVYRDALTPTPATEEPQSSASHHDGLTLAVLAVPAWMTPSDFLAFVAPAADSMTHLRIIRDSVPSRSLIVVRFNNRNAADEFAEAYNGRTFNSMEPEICRVVRVSSVVIDSEDSVSLAISRLGTNEGSMYEIPTCPVCLERMDSAVTGLITVPCSHTFHCSCLSKWGDSRCPVCRYSQTLLSSHPSSSSARSNVPIPFANPSSPTLSACSACSSTTNLWICLICGNIGCGRYGRAHAQAHYQSTTHLYALELETQRVWDYAGDGYVHRLIQNKADGKLVELPSAASSMTGGVPREGGGAGPGPSDALSAEKIEAIGIEYSYLLTSQLDSQRSYYEERTVELKTQVDELRGIVERLSRDFEKERVGFAEREAQRKEEDEAQLETLLNAKRTAEKRAKTMAELAARLDKDLRGERAVGQGLLDNLNKAKLELERSEKEKMERDQKIADLEDQVRDVMFFLEAKTKIEQEGGPENEAAGGSVSIPAVPSPTANGKKKKARR